MCPAMSARYLQEFIYFCGGINSQACPSLLKVDPIHYQRQDYADDNRKKDRQAYDTVLEVAAQVIWLIFWRLRYAGCHIWQ